MCNRKKAVDDAKKKPDDDCKAKKTCPEDLRIRITPKKVEYVVVLDKDGNPPAAYPILEFDITDGPPGYAVDVQIARDAPGLLADRLARQSRWQKDKPPPERVPKQLFSSQLNGDTVTLDGAGTATYKMPLDWWKDQARRPRKEFTTAKMYYRAVASQHPSQEPSVWSTKDGDTAPNVPVHNNLVKADVISSPIDAGYPAPGLNKPVDMIFTVREAGTTDMYNIVQWKKGDFELWPQLPPGTPRYGAVTDYNLAHRAHNPDWTIDRLLTDPRYWSDGYYISADKKTATATDAPGILGLGTATTHAFINFDFDTRIHLNFEIPGSVTITSQTGSAPVYDRVEGKIAPPEPFILDRTYWDARILAVRAADGTLTVTHPATFAGP